jgi:hypothetical protein
VTAARQLPAIPAGPVTTSEIGIDGSEAEDYRRLIAPFISPLSYRPSAKMSLKDWTRALSILIGLRITFAWWIGDALAAGERLYGDAYFLDALERAAAGRVSRESLLDYKYVALHVSADRRRPELPFSLHREVASAPPDVQVAWLDKAATGGQDGDPMTRAELRRMMQAQGVGLKGKGSLAHETQEPFAVRALRRAWDAAPDDQRRGFIEWTEPEWSRVGYRPPEEQLRMLMELRASLAHYGAHLNDCAYAPSLVAGAKVACSCGFERARAL